METKIEKDLYCLCTANGTVFDVSTLYYELTWKIESYNWIHKQLQDGHTRTELEDEEIDYIDDYDFNDEDFPLVIKKVKKEDIVFKSIVEVNDENHYF